MPRWDPAATLCGNCGHWSESSESGLGPGTGYCGYWQKLRERPDTCDHFVTLAAFARYQQELAARHEDWLDD